MQDFITLSEAIAVNCIGWRYDSIFVESTYNVERHIFDFQKMCHTLSGYTTVCDISFIDLYEKVFHNFQQVRIITPQKRTAIGKAFIEIGKYYCITIKACTEEKTLEPYDVEYNGCMNKENFEAAIGSSIVITKKKSLQSKYNCILGTDICGYDACVHFFRYLVVNIVKMKISIKRSR